MAAEQKGGTRNCTPPAIKDGRQGDQIGLLGLVRGPGWCPAMNPWHACGRSLHDGDDSLNGQARQG